MSKKLTKKQMFEQILAHTVDPTERTFIEHEIELLDNKSAKNGTKKPTKEQEANLALRGSIVSYLTEVDERMTITEMLRDIPACSGLSSQKVTQNVKRLVEAGDLVRVEEKGTAYFAIAG